MSEERRHHKRKLVQSSLKLLHSSRGEINATIHDISNNGVYVILPAVIDMTVGDDLQMQLHDSVNPALSFNMKLIHQDKGGIGLMFQDFAFDGKSYLMEQLKQFWSN